MYLHDHGFPYLYPTTFSLMGIKHIDVAFNFGVRKAFRKWTKVKPIMGVEKECEMNECKAYVKERRAKGCSAVGN